MGGRHWTNREVWRAVALLEEGYSVQQIARQLKRTPHGVRWQLEERRLSIPEQRGRSTGQVARLFGVNECTVRYWAERGWIQHHRPARWRWFSQEHVEAFIAAESSWVHWQPEDVTDPALRKWAIHLRASQALLTAEAAGHLLHCSPSTVLHRLADLGIPLVGTGRYRLVPHSALASVRAVLEAPRRRGGREYSEAEDAHLLRGMREGLRHTEIGRQLGRSVQSVRRRYYRLRLDGALTAATTAA